jgi:CRP/FNR family transcriptional regulator, cyclic AMP receptor protein
MRPIGTTTTSTASACPALHRLGPEVADAWRDSCLGALSCPSAARLLQGARVARLQAGETFYCGACHEETVMVALVVEGLLRLYAGADDGRQVTLRYARAGAVVGIAPILVAGPGAAGDRSLERWRLLGGDALCGEALRDTMILKLDPSTAHAAVTHDAEVARAIAFDLAERLTEARERLLAELFLPVRSRVAAQLLDLAERDGRWLVVRTSHQGIAASIGSVREVVARTLKRMQREGLVDRVGGPDGHLRLLDPAALHSLSTSTSTQRVRDEGASRPSARARSTASARVCAPSLA